MTDLLVFSGRRSQRRLRRKIRQSPLGHWYIHFAGSGRIEHLGPVQHSSPDACMVTLRFAYPHEDWTVQGPTCSLESVIRH